ncbi:MAG: restriction endonuclease [Methylacidiphilales bacterium]|nr:restriction endonuclease [Candidatus Methylacidiphilales bacterium]
MAKKSTAAPSPAADESKVAASHPKSSALLDTRLIYCGDNLEQLPKLPAACVDLIYIDPPFNSNRNYEVFWSETKEKRAFEDRHESTRAYIDYMRPRCVELARVLKKTGSFYYHCDWHASHYVKAMLDQIFGENNFQNEIIWRRNLAKGLALTGFPNNHDTLFYYGGGGPLTFHRPYDPYDADNLDEKTSSKYCHRDPDGRIYRLDNLVNPNPNRPNLTYEFMGVKRVWRWTKNRMEEALAQGIVVQTKPGAVPQLKRYLDEQEGRPFDSVWTDIPPINSQAKERLGYPTQKPLALLDRIINASSNPNDIVLDAFCGCGTALVAAHKLKRQWIGIDISPTACRVMAKRLRDVCGLPEKEPLWKIGRGFVVRDLPWTEEKLRAIPHFEFENWAVIALGGIPNKVQVGDMGVDGRIYPVSAVESRRKAGKDELSLEERWYPIQVKQKDKVGRPDIDSFQAMMMREGCDKGFFVSFAYSQDAITEIGSFFKRTGKVIVPLTVREIIDEQIAHKLA